MGGGRKVLMGGEPDWVMPSVEEGREGGEGGKKGEKVAALIHMKCLL